MCVDMVSTGFTGVNNANIQFGDCLLYTSRDASSINLELELENARLADEVQKGDIELSKAFEGMEVANIQRQSETRLALTLNGVMKSEGEDLVPYMEGGLAIKPLSLIHI